MLGAYATILAGSGAQSRRVIEASTEAWNHAKAPKHLLLDDPTKYQITLKNGGKTEALMASDGSVRGPHPQRLRLDEVDVMKLSIFDASLGQPMEKKGIAAQTVMSSTHQHSNGTMTEALKRAAQNGWPVMEWCWRDTLEPGGWLLQREVDRKRNEVPSAMWQVEYDLQEPSHEGLAFDREKLEEMFSAELGEGEGLEGEYLEFEAPHAASQYVTGVDWAKEKDWTVILTYKVGDLPWKLVAFERTGRKPWPLMVARLDERARKYKGQICHDATGIGNVVHDYLSVAAEGFVMGGRPRTDMFSEYIAAVERGEILAPRITFMYNGHKYCTNSDLYGTGHPPDDVVAGALAWRMRHKVVRSGLAPMGFGERAAQKGW